MLSSIAVMTVLGRVLAEVDQPAPDVEEPAVLFIKRSQVIYEDACFPDAGVDAGDGGIGDGGLPDAGVPDAGMPDAGLGDAGVGDASVPGDAGAPLCGVNVQSITMVIQPEVVRSFVDGTRFAILYVTPSRPIIAPEQEVFSGLAEVTAPEIEYDEVYIEDPALGRECAAGCGGGHNQQYESGGCGGGFSPTWSPPGEVIDGGLGDTGSEQIGPYEVARNEPADAQALAAWLDGLGYAYVQQDLDAVVPYLALGWTVTAIRIAADTPNRFALTPLAFTWPGTEIRVPVGLARPGDDLPAGSTSLTVYIAADGRYDLPNATIDFAKTTSFGNMGFLTKNQIVFDQNNPASMDPVATPSTIGTYHRVEVVRKEIRVPVTIDCDDDDIGCGCGDCNTRQKTRVDWAAIAIAVALVLRRRRR